jgi:hypothetical protein
MRRGLTTQRLLALFAAGVLLFNFPLLRIFDRDALLFGLPLLPAALFIAWAVLIVVLAWLLEGGRGDEDPDDAGAGPGAD